MGLIKEPLDIDFYVAPSPLTDKERALISQFILEYKAKHKANTIQTTRNVKHIDERPRPRA